jgi:hypothetical protein
VDRGQVVASELVVSGGYAPETFEPAKASFDDVSALVGVFVEAMQGASDRWLALTPFSFTGV